MHPLTSLFSAALLDACTDFATTVARAVADRDATVTAELLALEAQCCQLECEAPPLTVHFIVQNGELACVRGAADEPHVIVRGSAQAVLHSLWPAVIPAPAQTLRIDGDHGVLLAFQGLAARYRPDPVEALSRAIGDAATARLLGAVELGWRGVQSAVDAMKTELDQQSGQRFVNTGSMESLLSRTDALRLRLDRLEARAALLAKPRTEDADAASAP